MRSGYSFYFDTLSVRGGASREEKASIGKEHIQYGRTTPGVTRRIEIYGLPDFPYACETSIREIAKLYECVGEGPLSSFLPDTMLSR